MMIRPILHHKEIIRDEIEVIPIIDKFNDKQRNPGFIMYRFLLCTLIIQPATFLCSLLISLELILFFWYAFFEFIYQSSTTGIITNSTYLGWSYIIIDAASAASEWGFRMAVGTIGVVIAWLFSKLFKKSARQVRIFLNIYIVIMLILFISSLLLKTHLLIAILVFILLVQLILLNNNFLISYLNSTEKEDFESIDSIL